MREITCAAITATVRDLCIQANCQLPSDVRSAICAACAHDWRGVGLQRAAERVVVARGRAHACKREH